MPERNAAQDLLPLDVEFRIVAFHDERGAVRRHLFQPPRARLEILRDFFQREHNETVAAQSNPKNGRDAFRSSRHLYRELVLRVEGYPVAGGTDIQNLPPPAGLSETERKAWHWSERILPAHRIRAIFELGRVTRADHAAEIDPEFTVIELDAHWNGARPDTQSLFSNLLHRFDPLTDQELHDYEEKTTRLTEVKGSREPDFRSVAKQKALLDLYDMKIRSVAGYSVGAQGLADADQIRAWMDPFHKIAAAELLVRPYLLSAAAAAAGEDEDVAA